MRRMGMTAQMCRLLRGLAAAALSVLLLGCTDTAREPGTAEQTQVGVAAPQLNTGGAGALVAEPEDARGGQVVRVTFPKPQMRGVLYVLDAWDGQDWQPAFCLYSDGGGIPGWDISTKRYGKGCPVLDVGITGAGPDRVRMPKDAAPGTYRLCTGNAVKQKCGLLTVTA
jgi:hypothetical protein